MQTHVWSVLQNSSRGLSCFRHILSSRFSTGSISWCLFRRETVRAEKAEGNLRDKAQGKAYIGVIRWAPSISGVSMIGP
ncbi:hypothetical protein EYF80_009818 [Liparis tanakae]|uniref:Uncharacterized protein n=1 Tax=Liparis tanakae TaxID=230148 RepID=A0A4Z2IPQ2_9TELE|nr:hypothetical protein EYF80_009818 [Liparis tanakae]